ncbi:cyclin-C-like isoform X2 [Babylonia areolata]|uniref:cyclin-C-like isoform X2 n=1 Tax=Babylonia areolata TaxID=304850 RepID=UPI003FD63C5E
MAGNFWHSSHYQQWILDKQDLLRERQHDLKILTEDEYQKIMIFFANFIQALGEQLKVRQQVIATATVYFKRFYARNSLKCIDPWLMAPTCVFLASKVEEFGVISNSRLITTCQSVVKNKFGYAFPQEYPYRIQNVLECEFYLLEMMDCCMILYHAYRPLARYCADIGCESELLPLAWRIVNDSLRTDIPLLYPPYLIALACLHMACVIKQKDIKQWCAELSVDTDKILDIARTIIALYDMWKTYDEKTEIAAILAKMPKPKLSPSRPPSEGPTDRRVRTLVTRSPLDRPWHRHCRPQHPDNGVRFRSALLFFEWSSSGLFLSPPPPPPPHFHISSLGWPCGDRHACTCAEVFAFYLSSHRNIPKT